MSTSGSHLFRNLVRFVPRYTSAQIRTETNPGFVVRLRWESDPNLVQWLRDGKRVCFANSTNCRLTRTEDEVKKKSTSLRKLLVRRTHFWTTFENARRRPGFTRCSASVSRRRRCENVHFKSNRIESNLIYHIHNHTRYDTQWNVLGGFLQPQWYVRENKKRTNNKDKNIIRIYRKYIKKILGKNVQLRIQNLQLYIIVKI